MKNHLNLKKQFKEAITYLKSSSRYIYFSTLVFFLSTVIGFVFRDNFTGINTLLQEIFLRTEGLNTAELVFFIMQNNMQGALFAVVFGIFLGVAPLISAVSNGVVLGYVLGRTSEIAGFLIWWRLLPHGIFELPAIFIALGLGTKLGFSFPFQPKNRKELIYQTANAFLMIIIPLLIIAGIIEGILIGLSA